MYAVQVVYMMYVVVYVVNVVDMVAFVYELDVVVWTFAVSGLWCCHMCAFTQPVGAHGLATAEQSGG